MSRVDIEDARIVSLLRRMRWSPPNSADEDLARRVPAWELVEALPDIKPRVVFGKLRDMKRRGLLSACLCGCRSDIELPDHWSADRSLDISDRDERQTS